VASQIVIKTVGTNGGGFFNTNSAHPYENPTALSNLLTVVLEFMIGAALTMTFGRMVGNMRQGWALFGVMGILFLCGVSCPMGRKRRQWFVPSASIRRRRAGQRQLEARRSAGIVNSSISRRRRPTSDGAVCSTHDSYTPIGGGTVVNIRLGEVILAASAAALRHVAVRDHRAVHRRPDGQAHAEYPGKKLEAREVKMAILAMLAVPMATLVFTALATVLPVGLAGPENAGPHGFSEILYAYVSQSNNNGSAFAGLTGNTPFYNLTGAVAMMIGRFAIAIPVLAIAGSLAAKKLVPASAGTFPTDNGLFVALLLGIIIITGGLVYFPADALGPLVEHLQMQAASLY
jgi:K+-transporting ATPase ATPase A chain